MDTTQSNCDGYTARSGSTVIKPPVPCTLPAFTLITAGCIHEHIGDRELCEYHADDARAGAMLCGNCLNGPLPHDCHLRVMAETAH